MLGYFWRLILKLLRIFSELTAWVLCVWLMNTAFSLMTVRHFSAGDVPDRYFPVLVQDEQAQFYVKDWERLSNQGHQPVRDEVKLRLGEDYAHLRQIGADTYELYADLDTAMITTRYRIDKGRVEPLYSRTHSDVIIFFVAFISAFPLWASLRWLLPWIWRKRRRVQAV
ncbi:hypothetical protein [Conchiformibius kuhniae]|uniref:DUF2937 family protein n=2 Tax=Conchiformibius kuhniae TaxID=211502 RepID=A0A8T9MUH4_9NEIS|nr:hypothetical protein [Conchiformibius kuhniae]